jgi:hypothetical protein
LMVDWAKIVSNNNPKQSGRRNISWDKCFISENYADFFRVSIHCLDETRVVFVQVHFR